MKNKELVSYDRIVAAKIGEPDAMDIILAHYDGLIDFHSRRTLFDEYETPHTSIDPEIKQRIQAKIIDRIIYGFDPHRLPNEETPEE